MNKFVAFAAAGVLSVSALIAGQAAAQENENSAFAQMVRANTYGTSARLLRTTAPSVMATTRASWPRLRAPATSASVTSASFRRLKRHPSRTAQS